MMHRKFRQLLISIGKKKTYPRWLGFATVVVFLLVIIVVSSRLNELEASIEPVSADGTVTSDVLPTYDQGATPQFLIDTGGIVRETTQKEVTGKLEAESGAIQAHLIAIDGTVHPTLPVIDTNPQAPDEFIVKVPAGAEFSPGRFRLLVDMKNDSREKQLWHDFMWGVLAANVDKSVYRKGETIPIGVAVLDDDGTTLCDARVTVEVRDPIGNLHVYKTDDDSVVVSNTCQDKTVTYEPDYLATHQAENEGTHQVIIKAETVNGARSTSLSFDVNDRVEYVIHRKPMAMRIYPPEYYSTQAVLEIYKDFQGTVRERVPSSFEVSGAKLYRLRPGIEEPESLGDVEIIPVPEEKAKVLEWKDIRLSPNDQVWISYTYKMPDISPEFYLVGPITMEQRGLSDEGGKIQQIEVLREPRQWQIAADALSDASATRLWSAGFELNSTTAEMEYTANIGTTPTISTTTMRSGTYALETTRGGSGTSGIRYQFATADTATRTFFRAYLRIATLPNTTTTIMTLRDLAGTDQAGLRMTSTGALQLFNEEDNAQIGSDSSALSTNTWYRIELAADFGTAATGDTRVAARIDGDEFALSTTQNWANGTANIALGILTSATGSFFWDDLAVNQDAFTGQENWPGTGNIVHLRPNGNGTNTAWTGDYTAVDEVTPNDATDFIACVANTDVEDYTYQDSVDVGIGSLDNVRLVESWVRSGSTATGTRDHTTRIVSGGSNDTGPDTSVASTSWFTNDDTIPRNAEVVSYDDPGSTNYGPISATDLDGFQTQLVAGAASADCSPAVRVTAMWLLVEYVPAEGGRLFSSGFELQSSPLTEEFSSTAGTMTIDTTTRRSGAASLRTNGLASGTAEGVGYNFSGSNFSGPIFARAYLYVSSAPTAQNRIMVFGEASTVARAYITLDNALQLRLFDEDGQVGSASSALSLSTWYRVEIRFDATGAGATDTIEARIDGTNFATSATRDLSTGIVSFSVGGNLIGEAQTTGDWRFDDLAINGGWGATQNSYPGEGSIVHLRPNGNGDATAWTNTYTNIDEIDPDDATTVISTSTANAIEEAALDNSTTPGIGAADSITLVSAGVRMNTSAAATMALKVRLKDTASGPFIESANVVSTGTTWFTNANAVPRSYPITAYTRPMREDVFTPSTLDTLQIGVRETVDTTSNLQVTTLWTLVEYVPAVTITISGNAYEDEATTALVACDGSTNMIALRVGATTYGPTFCNDANGSFSIGSVVLPTAGTPLHLWIEGTTCNGDATSGSCGGSVIRYSGAGNITDAVVRRYRLVLRHDDAGPVTNADIGGWDNENDADVVHTVAGTNITSENFIKIIVNDGNTFTPGGTITTSPSNGASNADGDFSIGSGATLSIGTNALSVGGDFANAGTFTKSTGQTTTFTAVATGHTIEDGTSNFDSVVFNGTNGGWSFSSAVTIDVDLTMTAGTLSGTNNITVNGGDVTGDGTINLTGGSFLVDGTGNVGGATNWTFSNLTFGDGTGTATSTATGAGLHIVSSVLTINANQTLDAGSKTISLTGSGTPFVINGTFTPSSSTIRYDSTTGATITPTTYNHVTVSPSSGTPTFDFPATGSSWYNSSWSARKLVTVNESQVTGTSDHTNFPVLINLSSDTDLAADAQDDGDDIVFTSADGTTKLDHEIESFNGTTGALVAWVEVPTLDYNDNTLLYLYYGNSGASNQQNINGTWNSSYAGVWHFDETTGQHYDSTGNNNHSTSVSATVQGSATGIANGADEFSNNTSQFTLIPDSNSLDQSSLFTVEVWYEPDVLPGVGVYDCPITYGENTPNYYICVTDDELDAGYHDGSGYVSVESTNSPISINTMHHITVTFNNAGNVLEGFVNGVSVQTNSSATTNPETTGDLEIGSSVLGEAVDGVVDEVRISSVVRSNDWITTTYNSVSSPGTFYSLGSESLQPNKTITVNGDFTISGAGNATVNAETNDPIIDVAGSVSIGSGDTISASSTENFTVAGNWTNSGTFTANSGTVTFDSSTNGRTITTNGSSFNNVTFNHASGVWTIQDTLSVSGVLTINAGELNAGSQTINLNGGGTPFIVSGTFTPSTSTVSYNNTSGATVTSVTYYNLQFNPGSGTPTYTLGTGSGGGWYSTGGTWTARKQITIDEALVSGSSNLTNFPVLISRTDTDLQADAQADGDDILFTASDGTTKLDHEIERYTSGTGELIAWVEVPTLDYNDDTSIFMYYGNSGASNQQNANGVWDSNFAGVWHLKESGNGVADEFKDSSANLNHGQGRFSGQTPDQAAGKIGYAQDFNQASFDGISVPDDNTLDLTGDITLSAWVNRDPTVSYYQTIIAKRHSSSPNYQINLHTVSPYNLSFQGGATYSTSSTSVTASTWEYVTAVVNDTSNNVSIYKNGVFQSTLNSISAGAANSDNLNIGHINGGELWSGLIDEARVSNIQRSSDWIATEFNNQDDPGSFYSVGSEQSDAAQGISVLSSFTITGAGNATITANTNDPSIDIDGNLVIGSGDTFQASSTSTLTIGGDFTNNGTFTANSGTVIFDTAASTSTLTYAGATTFYNFTVVTTSKVIQFDNVDQTNITGTFTINGAACGTKVSLHSDSLSNQYNINATGTVSINYADVRDSNAIASLTANNSTSGGNNTNWTINNGGCSANAAPNSPSSLVQKKVTGGTTLSTGDWTNETQVQFEATVSDPDASDTLYLCVESDVLATSFSNSEDLCGSGVAYSGSGVTATVTITGLTDASEFHWQARVRDAANAYSSWLAYGSNLESVRDFGVDSTAPTGGTVYDGSSVGVDSDFNNGSLSALNANWASFNANASGLLRYEYSIGTTQGGTNIVNWTSNTTNTSVSVSSLTLQTSQPYYVNVRAIDNAGNVQSPAISSDGIFVSPELSFSISPSSTTFSNLNAGNSYTDTENTTLTTSTNAYNGYVVRAYAGDSLRETGGTRTIGMFNGGTYAAPDTWQGGDTGFGYTSSDTTIQGSNKFSSGTLYAPFSLVGPGDIVADHTTFVSGTPVTNEQFTITYRVTTTSTQSAGRYTTNLMYTATPTY